MHFTNQFVSIKCLWWRMDRGQCQSSFRPARPNPLSLIISFPSSQPFVKVKMAACLLCNLSPQRRVLVYLVDRKNGHFHSAINNDQLCVGFSCNWYRCFKVTHVKWKYLKVEQQNNSFFDIFNVCPVQKEFFQCCVPVRKVKFSRRLPIGRQLHYERSSVARLPTSQ